jgi:glycosyltransferase involved in cell wall biosynthesis
MRAALEQIIGAAAQPARVQLLGQRNDVPELLNIMDVFVLPSLGEGLCNTILEAMAVGLPVVATAVGGNGEMVRDGKTGALVPSANRDALATAIRRYLDAPELRSTHGEAGRRRVLAEFSIRSMIDGYQGLYWDALRAKSDRVAAVNAHVAANSRSL